MTRELIRVGWCEWVGLPDLGVPRIRAKMDTGAKTSALHAFDIRPVKRRDALHVRFETHVEISERERVIRCEALVVDERIVRSSTGVEEERFVICTALQIGERRWPIEVTLTTRDLMRFPMLIGREAQRGRLLIDPGSTYRLGRRHAEAQRRRRREP